MFREGLDLDGTGGADDSVTAFSYDDDSASGPLTVVEAALGTGEVLTWELPSTGHPRLLPASFTPSGRQSVVLVLEDRYSNYGAASCFVLAVEEGALTEDQLVVLRALQGEKRLSAEELVEAAGIPARRVLSALTLLQIRQLVEEEGRRFSTPVELQEES